MSILMIKVLWGNHTEEEATWKLATAMREIPTLVLSFKAEAFVKGQDCNGLNQTNVTSI